MTLARLLRIVRLRVRSLSARDQSDNELSAELTFHFDQLVAENVAEGLNPADARAAARRALGNVGVIEEECRDRRAVGWLLDFRQDALYGLRALRSAKTFTATAVLSLALGIGASTAILAVADSIFHRTLLFADPDRLFILRSFATDSPRQLTNVSVSDFVAWQRQARSFAAIGASLANQADFQFDQGVEHAEGQAFTPALFQTLGVMPWLGHTFSEQDVGRVVLISCDWWRRRFASDPGVVNRTILVDGHKTRIIGVMPPDFHFITDTAQYWVPLTGPSLQTSRNPGPGATRFLIVGARLKAGATLSQAQAEMSAIARRLDPAEGVRLVSIREGLFGWMLESFYTLAAGVGLLLLIGCANVSVLLLARTTARGPELAIRSALGAGRERLLRQMLAEGLLLAAGGGLAGLPIAWLIMRLAPALTPQPGGTHLPAPELNINVFVASLGVIVVVALGISIFPALASFRPRWRFMNKLRGLMIAAEVAIALALLTNAGLLTKSFLKLWTREYNFNVHSLASFDYHIPQQEYVQQNGSEYLLRPHPSEMIQRVFERLRQIPGAKVAGISHPPVNSLVVPRLMARTEESSATHPVSASVVTFVVTPGYFHTIEAKFVAGRDIEEGDTSGRTPVAVINETLARQFWPGRDPLRKRFGLAGFGLADFNGGTPIEVIGVIRDIPFRSAQTQPEPVACISLLQEPRVIYGPWANMLGQMTFVMRGRPTPDLFRMVRDAVAEVDPRHPISSAFSVEGRINGRMREWAYYAAAFLLMAGVASLLAAIGVYGTTAYTIERRRKELGVRLALGATRANVIGMLFRWTLLISSAGALVGMAGSILISRLIAEQLWRVTWFDPAVLFSGTAALLFIALLATCIPSIRTTRLDPASSLRAQD